MIDFISASEGMIELFVGDECVGQYRTPEMIAECIMKNGGPAGVIYNSSSMDFADEYGFDGPLDAWNVWQKVCDLL